MINITKYINEIKKNGITIIPDIITKDDCNFYIKKCNELIKKLINKKKTSTFSRECLWISSPFRHDKSFFKLLYFKKLDKILKSLIDQDYVLTNSSIINRKLTLINNEKGENMGDKWHTDSRYVGNKRLQQGFGYIAILMLEDFTKLNGCTKYISKSHFFKNKPPRNLKTKHNYLVGKKGSLAIMDTGIWHAGGQPSNKSRWSVYNYYSPWFVKPYYNYEKMLGKKKLKSLDINTKKLLHYYSTPPKNEDERIYTVTRP